ncbi:hypothetical protein P4O66_013126, partial [Electrophorus voltai]
TAVERQQVLQALERLQSKLVQREEWTHSDRLGALKEALQSPLLGRILTLQHSVKQLKDQLNSMPPDASSEFSFSRKGQLIVSASRPGSSLSSVASNGTTVSTVSSEQLQRWLQAAAKGRKMEHVNLSRPVSGGLGFSVVGLRPDGVGAHGVFIKQVQPRSIAARDGRLQENDQILAINGIALDQSVTQQQALALLQQQKDRVELVVARDTAAKLGLLPSGSVHTDKWGHVEEIELMNDGSGLGFGIVGGKTTGVIVRTIVPNTVADKDGRLRTGDHILRIGETLTWGLSSEQVVQVLQACGSCVRMLIARDPLGEVQPPAPPPPAPATAPITSLPPPPARRTSRTLNLEGYEIHEVSLKKKEGQSLGISIIGCNKSNSEDSVGAHVKSVVPGSAAEQSGNIMVHDRIIALNGVSLQGFTSQEVLDVMRQTGHIVHLTLVRKITTFKKSTMEKSLDKVQRESSRVSLRRSAEIKVRADVQTPSVMEPVESALTAIKHSGRVREPTPLTEMELHSKWEQALGPRYDVMVVELDPVIEDDAELQKYSKLLPIHTMRLGVELDSFDGHHYISTVAPEGPVAKHGLLRPEDELLEVNGVQLYGKSRREAVAFLREVPPPFTLVCCRRLTEEGTEYQPDAEEWCSSSPTASLQEVTYAWTYSHRHLNLDQKCAALLLHLVHMYTLYIKMCSKCSRLSSLFQQTPVIQQEVAEQRKVSEQSRPVREEERRESEDEEDEDGELALWAPEVQVLELEKGDRGLGFSILDYQDPLDTTRSVIVIRSLVAKGVAESHGGLLPGDQLVFVNDTHLDTCTLAQAVEVLKAALPGKVYLGIRKPLGAEERSSVEQISQEHQEELESPSTHAQLPVPKGFGNGSILLEDLDDEPELILDEMPRYASPLITTDRLPGLEREMAVDEEEEEERKGLSLDRDSTVSYSKESPSRKDPAVSKPHQALSLHVLQQQVRPSVSLRMGHEKDEDALVQDEEDFLAELVLSTKPPEHPFSEAARSWVEVAESDSDSRNGGSELTLTDTDTEVEVWPEPGESLGISIVGGRTVIKRLKNGEELKGIFIKQVLPEGPAGRTRELKTGDKILQVSEVDLQNASHEEAVQAIKAAPSPVVFIVQSLSSTPRVPLLTKLYKLPIKTPRPPVFLPINLPASPVSVTASSIRQHKAKRKGMPTASVLITSTFSLQPASKSSHCFPALRPQEGIRQKYGELVGDLLLVELEKDGQGLGLSLAGNRDRSCINIFVVGIAPGGPAGRDGRIRIGDELLEINNQVLYGRSHQNASAIIKSAAAKVKLVLLRNEDAISQMAVAPLPPQPSFFSPSEVQYALL